MNLKNAFLGLDNYFSPKIIGEVNDQYIKVVKIKGQEVPWHNHKNEDELFYFVKGALLLEIENQPGLILKKGELFIVKKGENHNSSNKNSISRPTLAKLVSKIKRHCRRNILVPSNQENHFRLKIIPNNIGLLVTESGEEG